MIAGHTAGYNLCFLNKKIRFKWINRVTDKNLTLRGHIGVM